MRCFIVVRDETDYNGIGIQGHERTYPKVFTDREAAEVWCKWEVEKAEDWYQSMIEVGESVDRWIPSCYVEESEFEMS